MFDAPVVVVLVAEDAEGERVVPLRRPVVQQQVGGGQRLLEPLHRRRHVLRPLRGSTAALGGGARGSGLSIAKQIAPGNILYTLYNTLLSITLYTIIIEYIFQHFYQTFANGILCTQFASTFMIMAKMAKSQNQQHKTHHDNRVVHSFISRLLEAEMPSGAGNRCVGEGTPKLEWKKYKQIGTLTLQTA